MTLKLPKKSHCWRIVIHLSEQIYCITHPSSLSISHQRGVTFSVLTLQILNTPQSIKQQQLVVTEVTQTALTIRIFTQSQEQNNKIKATKQEEDDQKVTLELKILCLSVCLLCLVTHAVDALVSRLHLGFEELKTF